MQHSFSTTRQFIQRRQEMSSNLLSK